MYINKLPEATFQVSLFVYVQVAVCVCFVGWYKLLRFAAVCDCITQWMRHLVYSVLDTSKELPSPIRPMLVPVFPACHQGSKWALTMSSFQRCFAHEFQCKSYPKYVHQKQLEKIFPTVYHTPVTGF